MKKIIRFCNKTAGSNWWLIATILTITLPAFAILHTFYQFISLHTDLIGRLFIGCDYSLFRFVWFDNHLTCQSPFAGNNASLNISFVADVLSLCLITLSDTFFRLWKKNVFLADPTIELYGHTTRALKFNAAQEMYFFKRLAIGKKGYWIPMIGHSRRFKPVKQRARCEFK